MTGTIDVISPGAYTSVQDAGRMGYRKYGVPVSGAMDTLSAALANKLLNNKPNAPVIEIALSGPKLKFNTTAHIVIAGADISPSCNDTPIPLNKVIAIEGGDVLSFGRLRGGLYAYVGIKGGIQTPAKLNSYSFFYPVTPVSKLRQGDQLSFESFVPGKVDSLATVKMDQEHFDCREIECATGPEFNLLSDDDKAKIFASHFVVSKDCNRMGYRLDHDPLTYPTDLNMITSAVLPGTVQLTPSGKLIVLMRDCQTTGGYPRVLQLDERGINRLAQKKAGDKFSFRLIPLKKN